MNKQLFDIIICGGGPAGMSAAARLSEKYSVLLIEKEKPGTTHATWYSYEDRAVKHGLEGAITVKSDRIRFTAPTQVHYMKDNCIVFDHNKVIQIWMNRAEKNGAKIVQDRFLTYGDMGEEVHVMCENGKYRARLLIDSTGITSPIVRNNNLVKRKDAWVIYGAQISNTKLDEPTLIDYFPLNDTANTYVGVHPMNESDVNYYIFRGENDSFGYPDDMKEQYFEVLKKEQPQAKVEQILKGSIVSGILKKYAFNRVILWGASGMLNPDGCGMGFNEILLKLDKFVWGIDQALSQDNLSAKRLSRVSRSLRDIETINFQRIIGAFSLYFIRSSGKWDGGVKWLNAMGEDSKYWMRNEMTLEWIMKANIKLHKVIPFKETVKMIPFGETVFIIEQLIKFSVGATISRFLKFMNWTKSKGNMIKGALNSSVK